MFARTERLLLRPGWREDAPALAQAIGDEAIVRNLAPAPWPYREADAEAFLGGGTDGHPSRFLMVRRTASSPRLIGGVGLDRRPGGDRTRDVPAQSVSVRFTPRARRNLYRKTKQ